MQQAKQGFPVSTTVPILNRHSVTVKISKKSRTTKNQYRRSAVLYSNKGPGIIRALL